MGRRGRAPAERSTSAARRSRSSRRPATAAPSSRWSSSTPPAGDFGGSSQKTAGRDLATQLADGLRRFKQLVETVRSCAPTRRRTGISLADHLKQRAAQPLERRRESDAVKATVLGRQATASTVENVPDPQILNARDAIIKITTTAICGSDLHLYDGYVPTMQKGDILGHEFMGEVVEVGQGVKNLKVGDRVVVPFPIACGNCNVVPHGCTRSARTRTRTRGIAEKMMGHPTARHLRLLAPDRRLRRRAGRVRARAVRRRRPDQDRGHRSADETGAVPVGHLPDGLHGRRLLRHQAAAT